jgi:hypothetical protein
VGINGKAAASLPHFQLVGIFIIFCVHFFPASAIFKMPSIVISCPTESLLNSVLLMACEVLGLEYEFRGVEQLGSGENKTPDNNLMVICLCLVYSRQGISIFNVS